MCVCMCVCVHTSKAQSTTDFDVFRREKVEAPTFVATSRFPFLFLLSVSFQRQFLTYFNHYRYSFVPLLEKEKQHKSQVIWANFNTFNQLANGLSFFFRLMLG